MAIPSEVNDLLNFLILLCVYIIPCLIGSSVSFYLKNRTILTGKKRHRSHLRISPLFIYAIIPAVIITFINIYWGDKLANPSMLFDVAVVAGALGEDITNIFTNIKVILEFLKKAPEATKDIDPMMVKLVEAVKAAEEEDEDESSEKKSDKK